MLVKIQLVRPLPWKTHCSGFGAQDLVPSLLLFVFKQHSSIFTRIVREAVIESMGKSHSLPWWHIAVTCGALKTQMPGCCLRGSVFTGWGTDWDF